MKRTLISFYLLLFCSLLASNRLAAQSFASLGIVGGTDEGDKIQTALNSGNGRRITLTMDGTKTYFSSKRLVIPDSVTLEGNGATLKDTNLVSDNKLFLGAKNSERHSATGLSIVVTAGSNTFTFGNASALTIGDIVLVSTDSAYIANGSDSYRHGFYGRVMGINNTTVTLEKPAVFSFTATYLKQYTTTTYIRINNLNVDLRGQTQGYGMGGQNVYDMKITGCKTIGDLKPTDALEIGFFAQGSNVLIDRCRAIDGKYSASGSDVAYGFNVTGHDITVQYCYAQNQRHGITSGGRSYSSTNVRYLYDTCIQGLGVAAPMDFHAMTWGVMKGNYIRANPPNTLCLEVRGDSTQVLDNDIEYDNRTNPVAIPTGIWLMEGASKNILIKNNRIKILNNPSGGGGRAVGNSATQPLGSLSNFRIDSNYFIGCGITLKGFFGTGVRIWANRFDQLSANYPEIRFGEGTFNNGYTVSYNKVINTTNGSTFNSFFNSQEDAATNAFVQYNELWLTDNNNNDVQFRLNGSGITCNNNIVHSNASSLTIVGEYGGATNNIKTPNTKVALGTTPPAAVACTAMKLDGVDNYVKVPDYNMSGDFTLEAWVKADGPGQTTSTGSGGLVAVPVLAKGRGEADSPAGVNMNYFLGLDASRHVVADFEESGGANHPVIGTTVLSSGVWTHIAATYQSSTSTWRLYVNGVLDITKDVGTGKLPNNNCMQPTAIGSALNSSGIADGYFQGSIDEVRIWTITRSTSQIAANYSKSFTETTTGLLGYYKFNETSAEQLIWDASPNSMHGTLGASAAVESVDPVRTTTTYAPLGDGCQVTAQIRSAVPGTILMEEVSPTGIEVFPNPVKEVATVRIHAAQSGLYNIRVTDLSGRSLYSRNVFINRANTERVRVALPKGGVGMYFVEVHGMGEYKSVKILKTR